MKKIRPSWLTPKVLNRSPVEVVASPSTRVELRFSAAPAKAALSQIWAFPSETKSCGEAFFHWTAWVTLSSREKTTGLSISDVVRSMPAAMSACVDQLSPPRPTSQTSV